MITAKEAYDRAEKKKNEAKETEMLKIEKTIEAASSNGFFRCTIDYTISNDAIEKLKASGYEVTVIPAQRLRERAKTIISWEKTI